MNTLPNPQMTPMTLGRMKLDYPAHSPEITATGQQKHSSHVADFCWNRIVRITYGIALRACIGVGESGSRRLCICCPWVWRVLITEAGAVEASLVLISEAT